MAEAVVLEPAINAGNNVDTLLDKLHQAFYDGQKDTWGEGPVAEQRAQAIMKASAPAPKRTPEEIEHMERRKAEHRARHAAIEAAALLDGRTRMAFAFRAYARNRGAE